MRNFVHFIGSTATGGVSQKLPTSDRAFAAVVFQQGKRPMDSEANLAQMTMLEQQRLAIKALCSSGATAALVPAATATANSFVAHSGSLITFFVDGRAFKVGNPAASNEIRATLSAPPVSGIRWDFVWLECWYQEVQPTTSPEAASSDVYTYGGIGNATLTNDLLIGGSEQSRRIQARWRVRAAADVDIDNYSNGFSHPTAVKAQAGAASPTSLSYSQDTTDPTLWIAGAGNNTDGTTLKAVDGHAYAIPLAFVGRSAGQTIVNLGDVEMMAPITRIINADQVDGFHASQSPTPSTIPVTSNNGKLANTFLNTGSGGLLDADTVDGFHASATAGANIIPVANGAGKINNAFLNTGSGGLLDADTVDGFHASATAGANIIPVANGAGKINNAFLNTGSGGLLDADTVDGFHASATAGANIIPVAGAGGKIAAAFFPTGHGNGLAGDTVDGYHASPTPAANTIPVLDGSGKLPSSVLPAGIDADTLDGIHAAGFALAGHTHEIAPIFENTATGSGTVTNGSGYVSIWSQQNTYLAGQSFIFWTIDLTPSNQTIEWQATIYVDGVVVGGILPIRNYGGGGHSGAGSFSVTAGSHTVSIRVETLTPSGSVTINAARATIWQPRAI